MTLAWPLHKNPASREPSKAPITRVKRAWERASSVQTAAPIHERARESGWLSNEQPKLSQTQLLIGSHHTITLSQHVVLEKKHTNDGIVLTAENGLIWGIGRTEADARRAVADLLDRYCYSLLVDPSLPASPKTLPDETKRWMKWLQDHVSRGAATVNPDVKLGFGEQFWRVNAVIPQAYTAVQQWLLHPGDLAFALMQLGQHAPAERESDLKTALFKALTHPNSMVREAAVWRLDRFIAEPEVRAKIEYIANGNDASEAVQDAAKDLLDL